MHRDRYAFPACAGGTLQYAVHVALAVATVAGKARSSIARSLRLVVVAQRCERVAAARMGAGRGRGNRRRLARGPAARGRGGVGRLPPYETLRRRLAECRGAGRGGAGRGGAIATLCAPPSPVLSGRRRHKMPQWAPGPPLQMLYSGL